MSSPLRLSTWCHKFLFYLLPVFMAWDWDQFLSVLFSWYTHNHWILPKFKVGPNGCGSDEKKRTWQFAARVALILNILEQVVSSDISSFFSSAGECEHSNIRFQYTWSPLQHQYFCGLSLLLLQNNCPLLWTPKVPSAKDSKNTPNMNSWESKFLFHLSEYKWS